MVKGAKMINRFSIVFMCLGISSFILCMEIKYQQGKEYYAAKILHCQHIAEKNDAQLSLPLSSPHRKDSLSNEGPLFSPRGRKNSRAEEIKKEVGMECEKFEIETTKGPKLMTREELDDLATIKLGELATALVAISPRIKKIK